MTPATLQIVLLVLGCVLLSMSAARRLPIPYPVLLVLVGLLVSLVPGLSSLSVEPDLVFFVFLPPVLWAAAYFTAWRDRVAARCRVRGGRRGPAWRAAPRGNNPRRREPCERCDGPDPVSRRCRGVGVGNVQSRRHARRFRAGRRSRRWHRPGCGMAGRACASPSRRPANADPGDVDGALSGLDTCGSRSGIRGTCLCCWRAHITSLIQHRRVARRPFTGSGGLEPGRLRNQRGAVPADRTATPCARI